MGNWNNPKIIQTIPEQHTSKAINQGTAENSHIWICKHTWKSANVKVQNIFHVRNNITWSTHYKYRPAATAYTLEAWFVSGT
jgi:hypothetical protein